MTFKSFVLGGATFVGLMGASSLLPAMAYTHHPSTPQERQQTDQLNQQQLANAQGGSATQTQTADATPAAAPANTADSTSMPATQANAAPTAPMAASAQSSAAAPTQTADATAAPASKEDTSMPATQAGATSNAPMAQNSAMAQPAATVSLAAVANSSKILANASVETSSGQAVGAVQKVAVGADGKAQSVDVALLGSQPKTVTIEANQLSYDQSRNVVVAQLSADQIQAMRASPQG